jgi:uncharacterized protein with von Willebrand factor type A (vWA) domain
MVASLVQHRRMAERGLMTDQPITVNPNPAHTTHIIIIVDMSGSMSSVEDDVRGGFNSYLDSLTDVGYEYRVTTTLFDTEFISLGVDIPARLATRLNERNYRARGNTALLDAVGKTIAEFQLRVPELPEGDRGIVVIQTDGRENASKEFTSATVKALLEKLQKSGWGVIYLSAGIDSWNQADSMGVARAQYLNTSGSSASYGGTYSGLSRGTRKFSGGAAAQSIVDDVEEDTHGK